METKSCSTCLHHDVCRTAEMMMKFAPHLTDQFNQFSKDLREFLGEHCPHYRVEELADE